MPLSTLKPFPIIGFPTYTNRGFGYSVTGLSFFEVSGVDGNVVASWGVGFEENYGCVLVLSKPKLSKLCYEFFETSSEAAD